MLCRSLIRGEVTAVISDDAVRNPESAGDHFLEVDSRSGFLIRDRHCFDPLGEFIDSDKQMSVPSRRRGWQWSNHIESPLGKRPSDGDHVELRSWRVRLRRESLASFTPPHEIFHVLGCGEPIESCSKSFSHQGSTACVVTADPFMDVSKDTLPVFGCYASLEDSRYASFVQLSVDQGEGQIGRASCRERVSSPV